MPRPPLSLRLKTPFGLSLLIFIAASLIASCRSPQLNSDITIRIIADGQEKEATVPSGLTVSLALEEAGVPVGALDKTDPPLYTVLNDGDIVKLIRVEEIFETEEVVIPFERQIVRNETLPEGETRLVQAGENGLEEVTYRTILEDKVEVSRTIVKSVLVAEALPEIVMVGSQASFVPLNIPGTLAYLAGGNAWIMEGSTANRRAIVSTGDLDGRIFTLSPNGEYLVFYAHSSRMLPAGANDRSLTHGRSGPGSAGGISTEKACGRQPASVHPQTAWPSTGYRTACHWSAGQPGWKGPGFRPGWPAR
ncbi:DUF348 domain-containing protein [Deltaproteobacteria bacterium PRO3]|nr:DUF348 domain-containing protein [Deltaproteobacteria bacterium PRO3]